MVDAGIITHVIGGIHALLSYDRASDPYGPSMRTAKILAILVGGIIALLVAGLLAVWLWVNPNDYKARMAGAGPGYGRRRQIVDIPLGGAGIGVRDPVEPAGVRRGAVPDLQGCHGA